LTHNRSGFVKLHFDSLHETEELGDGQPDIRSLRPSGCHHRLTP